ncbi:bifunctional hydroxymethylpyrimidine kinase/phosphomethylpyrimidine kinase [Senegalia sp. (in: firmicutes)]|uniref:bifunctional hydroxymethylpyrimidine kinase/phosphomethylpyrimidine kinase n=1 Tax=Senegalia sp. (in: firmicutes) TaxID=1924098 RepID=UPI003F99F543
MSKNNILLISDFVGIGKVALSVMIPILNTLETNVSYLPTAVVSNNFDYKQVIVEDLTEFMENTQNTWKELDFQFDTITTGILMNPKQVEIVKDIVNYHKKKPVIISDPIMGDNGNIYPGLSKDLVEASKLIALEADVLIPNLTEFCLIIGENYPKPNELNDSLLRSWLEKAKKQGIKSTIVTSVKINQNYYVYGYSKEEDIFRVKFDHIPVQVGGTGDIFTSLLIGKYKKGENLQMSVEYVTQVLSSIIKAEYQNDIVNSVNEIEIQKYLNKIHNMSLS